jgi:hypothetical protein
MLRVPPLGSILGVEFGLGGDDLTSLAVYKADDTPLEVELIQGSALSFTQFFASGTLDEEGFSIEGRIGGSLELDGFDPIQLQQARVDLAHTPQTDELAIEISGVSFGQLGEVEEARLRVTSTTDAAAGDKTLVMVAETTLAWVDLHSRLNLDDLSEPPPWKSGCACRICPGCPAPTCSKLRRATKWAWSKPSSRGASQLARMEPAGPLLKPASRTPYP